MHPCGPAASALYRAPRPEALIRVPHLQLLRGERPRLPVRGRTVIVVDDGLATGYTARAAVDVMRQLGARKVVLAVPVAPADRAAEIVGPRDPAALSST